MIKTNLKLAIVILLHTLITNNIFAQISDTTSISKGDTIVYVFTLANKNEVIGTIIKEEPRETTIKSQDGRILIIPSYEILSKKPISEATKVNGKVVFKNPHPSRYFFGPSALPMERRELYLSSVFFTTVQVQYGISENFSVGFTTSVLISPVALTAKYTIKLDKNNYFALGGMGGTFSWIAPDEYWGVAFATYTIGNSESNISATAGVFQSSLTSSASPLINFGAHKRLSKNISFMGELYYIPELETTIAGPFLRMYFNKSSCWDAGLLFLGRNDKIYPLPAFSYTFKFNQD